MDYSTISLKCPNLGRKIFDYVSNEIFGLRRCNDAHERLIEIKDEFKRMVEIQGGPSEDAFRAAALESSRRNERLKKCFEEYQQRKMSFIHGLDSMLEQYQTPLSHELLATVDAELQLHIEKMCQTMQRLDTALRGSEPTSLPRGSLKDLHDTAHTVRTLCDRRAGRRYAGGKYSISLMLEGDDEIDFVPRISNPSRETAFRLIVRMIESLDREQIDELSHSFGAP